MKTIPYHSDHFYHWTKIDIRFRDLDPLNHVNNSVFNSYFEEARIDFIYQIPEFKASMESGNSFVLVHIELDYIKPVHFPGAILVGSSVEEYGNSSIIGIQAIYSENTHQLKAIAKTTGVWFDLARNRPARLPEITDKEKFLFKWTDNG